MRRDTVNVLRRRRIVESNESLCLKLTGTGFDRIIKHFDIFQGSFPSGTVQRGVRLGIVHPNEQAARRSASEKNDSAQDD